LRFNSRTRKYQAEQASNSAESQQMVIWRQGRLGSRSWQLARKLADPVNL